MFKENAWTGFSRKCPESVPRAFPVPHGALGGPMGPISRPSGALGGPMGPISWPYGALWGPMGPWVPPCDASPWCYPVCNSWIGPRYSTLPYW